jgi:hypothetical protein
MKGCCQYTMPVSNKLILPPNTCCVRNQTTGFEVLASVSLKIVIIIIITIIIQ